MNVIRASTLGSISTQSRLERVIYHLIDRLEEQSGLSQQDAVTFTQAIANKALTTIPKEQQSQVASICEKCVQVFCKDTKNYLMLAKLDMALDRFCTKPVHTRRFTDNDLKRMQEGHTLEIYNPVVLTGLKQQENCNPLIEARNLINTDLNQACDAIIGNDDWKLEHAFDQKDHPTFRSFCGAKTSRQGYRGRSLATVIEETTQLQWLLPSCPTPLPFDKLPSIVFLCSEITELRAVKVGLKELSKEIENLQKLILLDLSKNDLDRLPLAKFAKLKSLYLAGNPRLNPQSVLALLPHLPQLQRLDVTDTPLASWQWVNKIVKIKPSCEVTWSASVSLQNLSNQKPFFIGASVDL